MFDVVVVMDPIGSIKIAKDSTFAMLLEAQRRGHTLWYVVPGGLWVRDGRAGATVQIVDSGVLFFDPLSGGAWFAPLPPDVVARLRATVPPAPR